MANEILLPNGDVIQTHATGDEIVAFHFSHLKHRAVSVSAHDHLANPRFTVVWRLKSLDAPLQSFHCGDQSTLTELDAPTGDFPKLVTAKGSVVKPSNLIYGAFFEAGNYSIGEEPRLVAVSELGNKNGASFARFIDRIRSPTEPVSAPPGPFMPAKPFFVRSAAILNGGLTFGLAETGPRHDDVLWLVIERQRRHTLQTGVITKAYPDTLYWNCKIEESRSAFESTVTPMWEGNARLASLQYCTNGRAIAVWHDNRLGAHSVRVTDTLASADDVMKLANGLHVMGVTVAGNPKEFFTITFAQLTEPPKRRMTIVSLPGNRVTTYATGPERSNRKFDFAGTTAEEINVSAEGAPSSPQHDAEAVSWKTAVVSSADPLQQQAYEALFGHFFVSSIDDLVMRHMFEHNIRGLQLAITKNDKLRFCRAYTWAEPWYPICTTSSAMSVGSVSKVITGITLLRVISARPWAFNKVDPLLTKINEVKSFLPSLANLNWGLFFAPGPNEDPNFGPVTDWNPAFFGITLQDLLRHLVGWYMIRKVAPKDWTIFEKTYPGKLHYPGIQEWSEPELNTAASHYLRWVDNHQPWKPVGPCDPETFLAYNASYSLVNPTTAHWLHAYQNCDHAIVAALIERAYNFPNDIAPFRTYPKIVNQEVWSALRHKNPAKLIARIGLHSRHTSDWPAHPFPQHADVPEVLLSPGAYPKLVASPDVHDNTRINGPFGGWRVPAADLARLLAACSLPLVAKKPLLQSWQHYFYIWQDPGDVIQERAPWGQDPTGEPDEQTTPTYEPKRLSKAGWIVSIDQGYDKKQVVWHNGQTRGAQAVCLMREDGIGMALVYNQVARQEDGREFWLGWARVEDNYLVAKLLQQVDKQLDAYGTDDLFQDPQLGYLPLIGSV
jgi:hypothetical protein